MSHADFVPPELLGRRVQRSADFGSGHPWGGRVLELEGLDAPDDPQRHIRVINGLPSTPTVLYVQV